MAQNTRQLQLKNGLRVILSEQPDTLQAAALLKANVGSHHEPASRLGLAHLLEHMLFTGSQHYAGQHTLMNWINRVGGRLNATTGAVESAYFFETDREKFADGLARLADMIFFPTFREQAIAQEVAIIDEESQLLQNSELHRRQAAAQFGLFERFQIGNRHSFGDDTARLRQELIAFHQTYYQPANMTLWLQAPLPLDQLEALATPFDSPTATKAIVPFTPITPQSYDWQLTTSADTALWYCPWLPFHSGNVSVLRECLCDEAPYSLLDQLNAGGIGYPLQKSARNRPLVAAMATLAPSAHP